MYKLFRDHSRSTAGLTAGLRELYWTRWSGVMLSALVATERGLLSSDSSVRRERRGRLRLSCPTATVVLAERSHAHRRVAVLERKLVSSATSWRWRSEPRYAHQVRAGGRGWGQRSPAPGATSRPPEASGRTCAMMSGVGPRPTAGKEQRLRPSCPSQEEGQNSER